MALTKQQKILGAVVALGVAAVGIDQFVLGGGASGPSQASASAALNQAVTEAAVATAPAATPADDQAADEAPGIITGHPELSDRLDRLASVQELKVEGMVDAFVPRGQWAQKQPEPTKQPRAEPFDQRHRLDAVMAVAGEAVAIVDGRTLRPGDLYDGYVLRQISDDSVTFEREGDRVQLLLPGADDGR
jgi:hypothetical protein